MSLLRAEAPSLCSLSKQRLWIGRRARKWRQKEQRSESRWNVWQPARQREEEVGKNEIMWRWQMKMCKYYRKRSSSFIVPVSSPSVSSFHPSPFSSLTTFPDRQMFLACSIWRSQNKTGTCLHDPKLSEVSSLALFSRGTNLQQQDLTPNKMLGCEEEEGVSEEMCVWKFQTLRYEKSGANRTIQHKKQGFAAPAWSQVGSISSSTV